MNEEVGFMRDRKL